MIFPIYGFVFLPLNWVIMFRFEEYFLKMAFGRQPAPLVYNLRDGIGCTFGSKEIGNNEKIYPFFSIFVFVLLLVFWLWKVRK